MERLNFKAMLLGVVIAFGAVASSNAAFFPVRDRIKGGDVVRYDRDDDAWLGHDFYGPLQDAFGAGDNYIEIVLNLREAVLAFNRSGLDKICPGIIGFCAFFGLYREAEMLLHYAEYLDNQGEPELGIDINEVCGGQTPLDIVEFINVDDAVLPVKVHSVRFLRRLKEDFRRLLIAYDALTAVALDRGAGGGAADR